MTEQEIKNAVWKMVEAYKEAFVYTTVDGQGCPRGRYMGGLIVRDNKIYMATFSGSRKMTQIADNPRSELIFASKGFKTVAALGGDSRIEKSLELKKAFWEAVPQTADYFSGYDAPEYGLIEFEPHSAEYLDLNVQTIPFVATLP